MLNDNKLRKILAALFLDIAKAWFIATFVTPTFIQYSYQELLIILTKGMVNVIVYIILVYIFS